MTTSANLTGRFLNINSNTTKEEILNVYAYNLRSVRMETTNVNTNAIDTMCSAIIEQAIEQIKNLKNI